jgi:type IV pilus assembly protein PilA
MLAKLNRRMKSDEGFTLIELLIVLIIIAILVAIAIPSYLGFRDRANERAAQSNVRSAVPSAEAFFSDNNHYNFSGTTSNTDSAANLTALRLIDTGMAAITAYGDADSYCFSQTIGNRTAKVVGPGGQVTSGVTDAAAGSTACANANG